MREFQISAITAGTSLSPEALEGMTFPAYRSLLRESGRNPEIVALAAYRNEHPAGLGLARLIGAQAEILSLFVSQEFRKRGIGASLLARMEEALCVRGGAGARLTYNSASPSATIVERILESRNWSTPQPSMLLAQVGREIMKATWFGARKLPAEIEMFPWTELTESERRVLEASQTESRWVPDVLWPFHYEANLERSNSLGLRREGEVIGWTITNRIGPKAVRYTATFVREEFRQPGRPFILIFEAIRRQAEALGYDSIGTFGIPMELEPMIRIVKRKFAPWLRSISETRISRKSLSAEGEMTTEVLDG